MGKELSEFSWQVLDRVQKAAKAKKITDAELIRKSGMPRNTFYVKMRGETPLTTEDVAKLARGLEIDPFCLIAEKPFE